MDGFSVLTYATHEQGTFAALKQAVPDLHVGGWGEPWQGFMQKFQYVLSFAKGCSDQHIIIFVDGFDTEVRLPPAEAVRRFRRMRVPFLVSALGAEMQVPPLLSRRIFRCTNSECANTGLYMGYAHTVRRVLEAALSEEYALLDDQRAFELARVKLPSRIIGVDSDCLVFHNLHLQERDEESRQRVKAVFVGRNGTTTFTSWKAGRGRVWHFSRVLVHEALLAVLVALLAACWVRFSMPRACCGSSIFPAIVIACCFFDPLPTLEGTSTIFLVALFCLVMSLVPPP